MLRIEKMEVPFEGGHSPNEAVARLWMDGWMDGWMDVVQTNYGTNPASCPEVTSVKVAKACN